MSSYSVSFHTFGCKLNQLETESISQAFSSEGFSIVPWGAAADLYVVNTCTVTSMAEQKARREIRKVLRERPSACVIATGCYAQLDPEALRSIADDLNSSLGDGSDRAVFDRNRIVVVSGDLKSALLDLPAFVGDSACTPSQLGEVLAAWASGRNRAEADPFRFDANDFAFHSRASLKIQDGCDNVCSYCRVRLARGKSVSLAAPEILSRLRELERRGYAEAVLTGINISRYRDSSGVDFAELLGILLDGTEKIALRISSTEPDGVDERFAEAVSPVRVRPHFHLSIQSGSDEVLNRMRRRYRASQVRRAAELLRSAKGDPFLACDVIAGFPGETDEDFLKSYELCGELGFAWIHAFPFSPRPGTEAAALVPKIPERVAGARVERLTALAREGRERYLRRWIGKEVEAIAEGRAAERFSSVENISTFPALSDNYLKLSVECVSRRPPRSGTAILCRIVGAAADALEAVSSHEADAAAELVEQ